MLAESSDNFNDTNSFSVNSIEAFELLYRNHWYTLYAMALKQTGSSQDAEELVQMLFERIWKNRDTLVVKNWGAFLAVSLRNQIIDFQRKNATEKKFLEHYKAETTTSGAEDIFNLHNLNETIEALLKQLPEKTQEVFKLSRFEKKSVKEIAGSMQLTEKAVEYHITKSLKLLRRHLRSYINYFFTIF